MAPPLTGVESVAHWATALTLDDVPADVRAGCRAQRHSVLGAVAASTTDAAAGRVVAAVAGWAGDGPAPLLGTGRRVPVEDALYAAAALSIALDFDDYVCFGHTGHSAVLVPALLAAETGASGSDQLVAQAAANEIEARLGGACLIGAQNGQLWSFIHGAGAAVAAGRLLGLDAHTLAHALAIALYQPPRATVPGFMAPDSKLLTASEPAAAGVRAARLAAAGVTGPLDALEHPSGFLAAFAEAPLPGLLGGLGRGWATHTLCVKPYPGCAYLDTTIDALLELGPPSADSVARVDVDAGLLTCGMDAMSAPYAAASPPTPVTVNFSVGWNVAVTLLAGELTPRQVSAPWLAEHRDELAALVQRVHLHHDGSLTRASAEQFVELLPPGRLVRDAGAARLRRGLRRVRQHHPSVLHVRDLRWAGELLRVRPTTTRFWDADALARFAMAFPARVRVRLTDGRELVASADVPRGGAGHPTHGPDPVARDKLRTWGPALWGEDGAAELAGAIDADERLDVALASPEPAR